MTVDLIFPDISHYQTVTDWAALRAATPAIIIKAANNTHRDPKFAIHQAKARQHQFPFIGYYQYLGKNADPEACARFLVSELTPLQPNEILILDIEEGDGDQTDRAQRWAIHIPGPRIIYSGLAFWATQLRALQTRHKWVAAYRNVEPTYPHRLWQFSSSHTFPGIAAPCDANLYHGDVASLLHDLGLAAPPQPHPHPHPTPEDDMTPEQVKMLERLDGQWARPIAPGGKDDYGVTYDHGNKSWQVGDMFNRLHGK